MAEEKFEYHDNMTEQELETAAARNSVNKDFYGSALIALRQFMHEDLNAKVKDGEFVWPTEQANKAACFTRQDVIAILIIQKALLRRLDTLHAIGTSCLAILIYIAYKIS